MLRSLMAGLLMLSSMPAAVMADSTVSFDVLGVRLGMTQTEVEATLTAYDPQAIIARKTSGFSYFNGWETQLTDVFVKTLKAEFPVKGGNLNIEFSPPPDEGRVVLITRTGGYNGKKAEFPPYENFLQSLIKKYGEPALEKRRSVGGALLWARPEGGKICLKKGATLPAKFNKINYDLSIPQDCARLLSYNLEPGTPGGPVERLEATAIDIAEIIRRESATNAWLKKLSNEARALRSKDTLAEDPDL